MRPSRGWRPYGQAALLMALAIAPPAGGWAQDDHEGLPGRRIPQPTVDGVRVDWCRLWGQECGQGAADAFCQGLGFAGATSFAMLADTPPTYVIGTGQRCEVADCDALVGVTCVLGPDAPGDGVEPEVTPPPPESPGRDLSRGEAQWNTALVAYPPLAEFFFPPAAKLGDPTNPEACRARCIDEARCMGWTYHQTIGRCQLFETFRLVGNEPESVSGDFRAGQP